MYMLRVQMRDSDVALYFPTEIEAQSIFDELCAWENEAPIVVCDAYGRKFQIRDTVDSISLFDVKQELTVIEVEKSMFQHEGQTLVQRRAAQASPGLVVRPPGSRGIMNG